MRGQRSGDTAVHAPRVSKPDNRPQQPAAAHSDESDIFSPRLFNEPIEYYFYPNSSVPVFCPTAAQFADFEALVSAIEPLALRGGVCKIIPPRRWREELEQRNSAVLDEEQFPIMKPIVQHFNGASGIFHQYNVEFHRKLKLAQFFQMSQDSSHRRPEVKVATCGEDEEEESSGEQNGKRSDDVNPEPHTDDDVKSTSRTTESDVVGVSVDYDTGEVRLTSAAAAALHGGIRSEAQRAQFAPATTRYRPQPDVAGEPACADHTGSRQPRRFTRDDGRALFVSQRELAESEELERVYWKNMAFQPPMYGADVLGTLFPDCADFPVWNIRNLPGLLRQIGQRMPGVNDPYLYLGMWKATFAWHVEDMDLYSINYIHFGEPKAWYAIPIDAHSRFEMSMQNVFANDYKSCSQFLRHKAFLLSPRFLAAQGIPFNRVVQRAGEIILTFPKGYHAGFNHGFNCAESVNFALDHWLDIAWASKHCECIKDSVTIDLMEWFGDARRARMHQESPATAKNKGAASRVSPRRHAAAAVALANTGALAVSDDSDDGQKHKLRRPGRPRKSAVDNNSSIGDSGSAHGTKRRPSQAPRPEPGAKRPPHPTTASPSHEPEPVVCDPARQFASLFTPVGTCGACLQLVSDADTAEMVECQQCGLTVHAQCSALEYDDNSYRCANCEMDTDQLSCSLCAFQNGLLLPVRDECNNDSGDGGGSRFVHFLCANFISETYFDAPDQQQQQLKQQQPTSVDSLARTDRVSTRSRTAALAASSSSTSSPSLPAELMRSSAKVCGVQSISKSRFSAKCMYCCDANVDCFGAVAQCAQPKCFRLFHPMCAAVCGEQGLLDWSQYKAYCPGHRPIIASTTPS